MSLPVLLKRAYQTVAVVALLNMVLFAGVAMALVTSGRIDGDKARRIVDVIRGELPGEQESPPAPVEQPQQQAGERDASEQRQFDEEVTRREATRLQAELEQRMALNNRILLQITARREEFEREKADLAKQAQLSDSVRRQEGFKKQIEIFELLKPRVALQHLLSIEDTEEAAGLLAEMDSRSAKNIVEMARDEQELARIQAILQRVKEIAPSRSEELESD